MFMCVVVVVSDDWTRAFLIANSLKAVCWKVFESLSTEFIIILLPPPSSTISNKKSGRTWYGNALHSQSSYRVQTLPRSFLHLLCSLTLILVPLQFYRVFFQVLRFFGVFNLFFLLHRSPRGCSGYLYALPYPKHCNGTCFTFVATDSGLHDGCCLLALHR